MDLGPEKVSWKLVHTVVPEQREFVTVSQVRASSGSGVKANDPREQPTHAF